MNNEKMNTRFSLMLDVLISSLREIGDEYIHFQVAGNEEPIQRERIFCGELYHQMRGLGEHLGYMINIEPNKKRHPIIERQCGSVDPDIVVHRPGYMGPEDNLAVIEIKASAGDLTDGIEKDLNTINCMTTINNGYHGGVVIVFGPLTDSKKENLIKRIGRLKSLKMARFVLILLSEAKSMPELYEM